MVCLFVYRSLASIKKKVDHCNISVDELDCKFLLVFHSKHDQKGESERERETERERNKERDKQTEAERNKKGVVGMAEHHAPSKCHISLDGAQLTPYKSFIRK